ncbi:MAG: hypothetical protein P1Q69_02585 [Candidatus Thorarchaeota archaeon]|nr:hypothetical protein [Candidatus Thorarchaeota archaeon]
MSEDERKIVDPEERKKLIQDIAGIKDTLDSYKYGLNFEEFANELFQTVDRMTVAVKHLNDQMTSILTRMEKLETRLDEGIKVRVKGFSGEGLEGQEEVMIEEPPRDETEEDTISEVDQAAIDELRSQKAVLETKIAKLFETVNDYEEMALTDPASSDEYDQKAQVAEDMRASLEEQLKTINKKLANE